MVLINHAGREINAKIVYYGPGLSGKTTNIECIYASVPGDSRGKMVSMKTRQDRTLFFDFLPLELGEIHGFRTRFLLYTVPGQVFYNATRKLVLKGADAVVFVADSTQGKLEESLTSLRNLEENMRENNLSLDSLPWVIQYNKRDLPQVHSIEEMQQVLNPRGVPYFEAAAATGRGVYETLHAVSRLLFMRLRSEFGKHSGNSRDTGGTQPGGALAAPPVSTQMAWAPSAPAPAPAGPTSQSTLMSLGASPSLRYESEPRHDAPVDFGRTIELPRAAEPRPRIPESQGFIRDPLRRPEAQGDARPADAGQTVVRVPVVIRRHEAKPGAPIQIVLDVRFEP